MNEYTTSMVKMEDLLKCFMEVTKHVEDSVLQKIRQDAGAAIHQSETLRLYPPPTNDHL